MEPEVQTETGGSKIFFLKFFIISIFILMIAVAYAFFADNSNRNVVSEDKIAIDVSLPNFVESGEIINARVSVVNKNNSAIKSAKLFITYDESVSSSGEIHTNKINVDIGNVEALSVVNKDAEFMFVGRQEDIRKISARLDYSVDGSAAVFVKEYKGQTKIKSEEFLLNVYGGEEAIVDLDNFYKVNLKNISNKDFTNLFLKIELPKEFSLYSSSSEQVSKIFDIPSVKSGEELEFNFKGYFKNIKNEKRNFRAYLYSKDVDEKVLAYSQLETSIISSPIEVILTAEVNDQKVGTLSIGKDANLNFIITNIGNYAIDELSVLFNFAGKKEVYSSDQKANLKRLNPGESVSFDHTFKSINASSTSVSIDIFGKTKGEFEESELIKQVYILKAE